MGIYTSVLPCYNSSTSRKTTTKKTHLNPTVLCSITFKKPNKQIKKNPTTCYNFIATKNDRIPLSAYRNQGRSIKSGLLTAFFQLHLLLRTTIAPIMRPLEHSASVITLKAALHSPCLLGREVT